MFKVNIFIRKEASWDAECENIKIGKGSQRW